MTQAHKDLHDKLDWLFDQIKNQIDTNPERAQDLLLHCIDLIKINFNKLRR